jgi:hypothetical protein
MIVDGAEKTLLMVRDITEEIQIEKIQQKHEEE